MKESKEGKENVKGGENMKKDTIRLYFAVINTPDTIPYVINNGINAYPGTDYVPLALSREDAVERLLCECKAHNTDPGNLVIIFYVDIPISIYMNLVSMTISSLDFQYFGFKEKVPPKYINGGERDVIYVFEDQ